MGVTAMIKHSCLGRPTSPPELGSAPGSSGVLFRPQMSMTWAERRTLGAAAPAAPRDQIPLKSCRYIVLVTFAVAAYIYVRESTEVAVISGFHLHVTDLVFVATLAYCVSAVAHRSRLSTLEFCLVFLGGILLVNFGRGILATDAATAGVEFRTFSVFIATVIFAIIVFPRLNFEWVYDKVVLLGWGLVLLSILRLGLGLDAFITEEVDPVVGAEARALNGAAALMLGDALLVALTRILGAIDAEPRRRNAVSALVFAGALLISDQHTAIYATLVGVGVVLATSPRRQRMAVAVVGAVVIIGSAALFVMWVASDGDLERILPQIFTSHDLTYEWRLQQWLNYLDFYASAGPIDQLIGLPLGVLPGGRLGKRRTFLLGSTAHSYYVELLLTSGAIGALLFVATLFAALARGLLRLARGDPRSQEVRLAVAIVVSQGVFSYAYSLPGEQGLLLAIAAQTIAAARTRSGRPAEF